MAVKIIWNSHEWAEALRGLPIEGPLPNRTVLVPSAGLSRMSYGESSIRNGQQHALAGTRFVSPRIAAMEVLRGAGIEFEPGEETLRKTRLSALFRSDLILRHFPIDLLRSTPGWDDAFARTISDLEGAGLRPEDIEPGASPQLQDVLTLWRLSISLRGIAGPPDASIVKRLWCLRRIPRPGAFPDPRLFLSLAISLLRKRDFSVRFLSSPSLW